MSRKASLNNSLEKNEFNVRNIEIVKADIVVKRKEKWYFKMIQIIIPFFIAGFGMVGAGILFSFVQVSIEII